MTASTPVGPRQPSLLAGGAPGRDQRSHTERIELGHRSWIDWCPGWLDGADTLFEWCATTAGWQGGTRPMYDRIVAEPRLTATLTPSDLRTQPTIVDVADELTTTYQRPLHRVFASFYRDGHDSVAWHGDRIGRTRSHPVIPVLSLGGPRTFAIRPTSGGRARHFEMYSGDLLVMGGGCQQHFQHAVPKRRTALPRISLTFRTQEDTGERSASPER
ncbi:MAG: alpha-ketoglutarate-dependent dioxygenase AlkB [Acidimicrobiales bacterium]